MANEWTDLIRFFNNLSEDAKLQAFIYAMNTEADRQVLKNQAEDFKMMFTFNRTVIKNETV